jgi:iron complex transport system substrate-binding protein
MEDIGAAILIVGYGDTLDDILSNYQEICTAFEGVEMGNLRGRQLRYYADAVLTYVNDEVSSQLKEGDSAIYLRKLPFVMATGDTFEGSLLTGMGFVNQADQYSNWSYPPENEPDLNPEYLFCDPSITLDELRECDYYKQTSAVVNERIYQIDSGIFERQSPNMFLKIEEI